MKQTQRHAPPRPRDLTIAMLAIEFVCRRFGVTTAQLEGPRGKEPIVWARYVAIYLIYRQTKLPMPKIALLFDRDPSTVQHALHSKAAEARAQEMSALAAEFLYSVVATQNPTTNANV